MTTLPPGPKSEPILGGFRRFQQNRLAFLLDAAQNYGDIAYTTFVGQPFALLNHPDDVRLVLVEHAEKFHKIDRSRKGQTVSLANSEGEIWRRRRKLVAPAFHHAAVTRYAERMTALTSEKFTHWDALGTFDARSEMSKLTMNIAGELLLTANVTDETDAMMRLLHKGQEFLDLRARNPVGAIFMLARNWEVFKDYLRIRERIVSIVRERRQTDSERHDLLAMLINARDENGDTLADEEVADEAFGLFVAGHETTATALTWTLYLLAQHPQIQEQLATNPLGYNEAVIKEAMRLYPPAWVMVRRAAPAILIRGYTLPKNTTLAISPYTMHRDPRFFPDPERFDPIRFMSDVPRYAYLPFGAGPRICIGNQFALMEAQVVLTEFIQRYRVALMPNLDVAPEPLITLRPKQPVLLTIERR